MHLLDEQPEQQEPGGDDERAACGNRVPYWLTTERGADPLSRADQFARASRQYLDADANILRFQERFRVAGEAMESADTEAVRFVFGDPELSVGNLPRRTAVERAVGDHLRAGGNWYIGHGWFAL